MSVPFDSCITRIGVRTPDHWIESYGVSLPMGHVVSYDRHGNPASYAGDFRWDLTAYTSHGKSCVLYFDYWETGNRQEIDESQLTDARVARVRELQFLMCKRQYPSDGTTLSPVGLKAALYPLCRLARFAEKHNLSVRDVFEHRDWLDAFINELAGSICEAFGVWLNFLSKLDPTTELGFRVATPLRLNELQDRRRRYRDNAKQYAPLPTSIYSQFISNLSAELDDVREHKGMLLNALREAIHLHAQAKDDNRISIGPELIARYGLESYFDKRGHACRMLGLNGVISEIFQLCALQVHTFSGMRHNESTTLPFHCMESEKRNGRTHALFIGSTTKLNSGRRMRTKWVTTEEDGFSAARLAQEFAAVIYDSMAILPSESDEHRDSYPLFVSPDYLPWGVHREGNAESERFQSHSLHLKDVRHETRTRLYPTVAAEDIAELEDVDPFRAWGEEEKFAIGKPWPLSKHQLRRSLALYARASGCVRLSSLRRQLQHISNDMSAYYGNGCAFAKNFLDEDPKAFRQHIAFEWQDSAEEAALLAFVRDVLNSDEPLYGGAGNFYEAQRSNGTLMTRDQVEKAIRAGTMGYKTSPLGGCTKAGPCEGRMGLNFVDVACASDNCKNLVGKHSKIIQVIKAKRGMLERIDNTTLTYKAEKEELEELERVEARWRPQDVPETASQGGYRA